MSIPSSSNQKPLSAFLINVKPSFHRFLSLQTVPTDSTNSESLWISDWREKAISSFFLQWHIDLHFQMASSPSGNPHPSYRVNGWSRFFHRYERQCFCSDHSRSCSSWVSSLLKRSLKQGTLHLTDLYDLQPHLESKRLTESLESNWLDETKQTKRSPSLARAMIRTIGWRPFLMGLLLIPHVGEQCKGGHVH